MLYLIKFAVISDGVSEINADVLVDFPRRRIVIRHHLLHDFEFFRGRSLFVELISRVFGKLDHAVLREIFHAAAVIAAPFVHHCLFTEVYGNECKLVQPAVQAAVRIDVTAGLARAHRNAEHAVIAEIDRTGERGNVAVVRYFQRRAELGGDVDIHIFHVLFKVFFGHFQKERSDHDLIIYVNARARNADRIYTGHFRGRRGECRLDSLVMIFPVGIGLGKPHDFFAVHNFAVHHGAHLSVAPAGVETDAASVEVAADLQRTGIFFRQLIRRHVQNLKRRLVYLAHEVRVEFARAAFFVHSGDLFRNVIVAAYVYLVAAGHPKERFYQPFRYTEVFFPFVFIRKNFQGINIIIPFISFYAQSQRLMRFFFSRRFELAEREDHRTEPFIVIERIFHCFYPPLRLNYIIYRKKMLYKFIVRFCTKRHKRLKSFVKYCIMQTWKTNTEIIYRTF